MQKIRQIIASLVLILSTLYICGTAGFLPQWLSPKWIISLQIIPAILSISGATLIAITTLTILLGRAYCSTLCPLGITQDIIIRLHQQHKKNRKTKHNLNEYKPPHNILRYSILLICTLSLLLGSSYFILLLDPYSIYGRFCSTILSPFITLINRTKDFQGPETTIALSTIVTFGIIIYLNIKHKRLWCNSICPVGTLLGIISRFSIFKIRTNNKCIDCKACARACKSDIIDYKNGYKIDHSRCVSCYNCIDACKTGAIKLYITQPNRKDDKKHQ